MWQVSTSMRLLMIHASYMNNAAKKISKSLSIIKKSLYFEHNVSNNISMKKKVHGFDKHILNIKSLKYKVYEFTRHSQVSF